ncbi:MAG: GNAT family N-acetyltransferase [Proteobacteria bacterium]|nr:GNAT family N-acetyltransferase [Pseudomonadota bacterium]
MLELQNIKPEPILNDDAVWFKQLFFECFGKEDTWLENFEDNKYQTFHIKRQSFIVMYVVNDQTDLLTIGVAKNARKQGLATKLINWAIDMAPLGQKFFLEVECSNTAATNLYKKIGFKQISVRKNYYQKDDDGAVDALVMTYQKLS